MNKQRPETNRPDDLCQVYDERYQGDYMLDFGGIEVTRRDLLLRVLRDVPLDAGTVLDAGCGQGRYLNVLRQLYPTCKLSGCDISAVAVAKARVSVSDADIRVMDGNSFPFPDAAFNLVLSVEVIEHVDNVPAYFAEIARMLKPGGWLVFTTPCANRYSLEWFWAHLIPNGVQPSPDGFRRWFYEDATHIRRFTSTEAERLLQAAGLHRVYFRFWCHLLATLTWLVADRLHCPVLPQEGIGRKARRLLCHAIHLLMPVAYGLAYLEGRCLGRFPQGAGMIGVFRKTPQDGA